MPQILTSIPTKPERIKQLKAIRQIESTKRPGDTVQLIVNNVAVTMLVRGVSV